MIKKIPIEKVELFIGNNDLVNLRLFMNDEVIDEYRKIFQKQDIQIDILSSKIIKDEGGV